MKRRLKSADQQKIVFHDDLEATLTDGDAWYDEFRRQMDDYADKWPASTIPSEAYFRRSTSCPPSTAVTTKRNFFTLGGKDAIGVCQ
jgi:hypothetical protein